MAVEERHDDRENVDETPPPEEPLSLDTTFTLLRNRRRRDVLRYLDAHDGESSLSDLAEHIAAMENDVEQVELSSTQRKRVYIGLYQVHLPKLATAGAVEFDKHRKTVELADAAPELFEYLEAVDDELERPAPRVPLVAATLLVLVLAAWFGVPPLGWVSGTAWVVLASAVALGVAGYRQR